jgi:hypothetical protein
MQGYVGHTLGWYTCHSKQRDRIVGSNEILHTRAWLHASPINIQGMKLILIQAKALWSTYFSSDNRYLSEYFNLAFENGMSGFFFNTSI